MGAIRPDRRCLRPSSWSVIQVGISSGQRANISGYGHHSGRRSFCGRAGSNGRIIHPSCKVHRPLRPRRAERGGSTSCQSYSPSSTSCSMQTRTVFGMRSTDGSGCCADPGRAGVAGGLAGRSSGARKGWDGCSGGSDSLAQFRRG